MSTSCITITTLAVQMLFGRTVRLFLLSCDTVNLVYYPFYWLHVILLHPGLLLKKISTLLCKTTNNFISLVGGYKSCFICLKGWLLVSKFLNYYVRVDFVHTHGCGCYHVHMSFLNITRKKSCYWIYVLQIPGLFFTTLSCHDQMIHFTEPPYCMH
jgi:hypothetical protein